MIHKVVSFLVKPITCQPAFFILLYVLLNVLDIYALAAYYSYMPFYKMVLGLVCVYILSIPVILVPLRFRKVYKSVLLVSAILFFVIDLQCLFMYRETLRTLPLDLIEAIMATNAEEAHGFFENYVTIDRFIIITLSILLLLVVFYYLKRLRFKFSNKSHLLIFVILSVSFVYSVSKFEQITNGNIYYILTKKNVDLRDYKQNPDVLCSDVQPEQIVLILGESFQRSHSSLCGYDKLTNPLLGQLQNDSSLLFYGNVTSVATTTIPSVKSIMTGYIDEMCDSIEWFKCLTLLEVIHKAGYKTYWCSNQCKSGLWDNEVASFASLCDAQYFLNTGKELASIEERRRGDYDENLIAVVKDYKSLNASGKAFYVVHMRGSHFLYNQRYPENFSRFKPEDYLQSCPHLSAESRRIMSEYDNSVLYNDSVVYEIMNIFEEQNAIVFYLSDHGEDVFDSSDDFAGHTINGNEISERVGREIPLMMYTTPLFREKHPELQKRIEGALDRPYRTDSIMYTIMDIAGVETVNGISYKHKSLFK